MIATTSVTVLERHRRAILGLPAVHLRQSFMRSRLDAGPRFREQLGDNESQHDD
jgi:hypothetical protein